MSDSIIIRGKWVICGSGPDDTIRDGAVVVDGGRIAAVGSWNELSDAYQNTTVLGSENAAVIPGLINAHHHTGSLSYWLNGIADDLLEPWIVMTRLARDPDVRLGTTLSAAKLLRTGVTAVMDLCGSGQDPRSFEHNINDKACAYDDVGLRVRLAPGSTETSLIVHGIGEDDRFLASLPDDLAAGVRRFFIDVPRLTSEEYLDGVERLNAAWRDHPTVSVWYGPPGPQWVRAETMQEAARRAAKLDAGVQTHATESHYEKLESLRNHGKTAISYLRDLGVLDERFSIAHGVWVTERDIETLAETGAGLSHNPSSNLRLRAGIAPLNALLASGVTVGLGLDATTINDDDDMFDEMRLALRLHRTPDIGGPAPSIRQVFDMATIGGAKILGMGGEIGRLESGYRADIAVLDLDRIGWPWLSPEADPLETIVMRARAEDVATVMVGGDIVLRGGQTTKIDLAATGSAIRSQLDGVEIDPAYDRVVRALVPHLEQWYAAWGYPSHDPYDPMNSRL